MSPQSKFKKKIFWHATAKRHHFRFQSYLRVGNISL